VRHGREDRVLELAESVVSRHMSRSAVDIADPAPRGKAVQRLNPSNLRNSSNCITMVYWRGLD
jgi:hypothetical protein